MDRNRKVLLAWETTGGLFALVVTCLLLIVAGGNPTTVLLLALLYGLLPFMAGAWVVEKILEAAYPEAMKARRANSHGSVDPGK